MFLTSSSHVCVCSFVNYASTRVRWIGGGLCFLVWTPLARSVSLGIRHTTMVRSSICGSEPIIIASDYRLDDGCWLEKASGAENKNAWSAIVGYCYCTNKSPTIYTNPYKQISQELRGNCVYVWSTMRVDANDEPPHLMFAYCICFAGDRPICGRVAHNPLI